MPDEKRNPDREEQESQVPQRKPELDIDEDEMPRDPQRRDDSDEDDDEDDRPTGEHPPIDPDAR